MCVEYTAPQYLIESLHLGEMCMNAKYRYHVRKLFYQLNVHFKERDLKVWYMAAKKNYSFI